MADDIDEAALIFGSKVAPILERMMKERGASVPSDLPREVAVEILLKASAEAAMLHFPHMNVEKLLHGTKAFTNPIFTEARNRMEREIRKSKDAFDFCVGPDAAIVLAGFGVKVAPFDRKKNSIVGNPTNDIEDVEKSFSKMKTAFVGYSPCEAEFYCLVTDSLSDLKVKIETEIALKPVAEIVKRIGDELPAGNGSKFQHFAAVFARWDGDRFKTAFVEDPRMDRGSVLFQAGWCEDGIREGAPNDGFLPVPLALLKGALADPKLAFWLTEPKGSVVLH